MIREIAQETSPSYPNLNFQTGGNTQTDLTPEGIQSQTWSSQMGMLTVCSPADVWRGSQDPYLGGQLLVPPFIGHSAPIARVYRLERTRGAGAPLYTLLGEGFLGVDCWWESTHTPVHNHSFMLCKDTQWNLGRIVPRCHWDLRRRSGCCPVTP